VVALGEAVRDTFAVNRLHRLMKAGKLSGRHGAALDR